MHKLILGVFQDIQKKIYFSLNVKYLRNLPSYTFLMRKIFLCLVYEIFYLQEFLGG